MNETGLETAAEETTDAVKLKIIDADIHPRMNGMHQLHPYLSRIVAQAHGGGAAQFRQGPQHRAKRLFDSEALVLPSPMARNAPTPCRPTAGGPGSNLDMLRSHHLDKYGVDTGILIAGDSVRHRGDCRTPTWRRPSSRRTTTGCSTSGVKRKPRLKLAMHVGPRRPGARRQGNRENRRASRRGCRCRFPRWTFLLGNRHYYPIYEAARSHGPGHRDARRRRGGGGGTRP